MKSTKKFLCYSLALIGAALIFTVGCKKGDTGPAGANGSTGSTSSKPVVSLASITNTAGAAQLDAGAYLIYGGSTMPTEVGFRFTVQSASNTVTGSVTSTVPVYPATYFNAIDKLHTAALASSLTYTTLGTLTWTVTPYAINSVGESEAYSTLTNKAVTLTTTN